MPAGDSQTRDPGMGVGRIEAAQGIEASDALEIRSRSDAQGPKPKVRTRPRTASLPPAEARQGPRSNAASSGRDCGRRQDEQERPSERLLGNGLRIGAGTSVGTPGNRSIPGSVVAFQV